MKLQKWKQAKHYVYPAPAVHHYGNNMGQTQSQEITLASLQQQQLQYMQLWTRGYSQTTLTIRGRQVVGPGNVNGMQISPYNSKEIPSQILNKDRWSRMGKICSTQFVNAPLRRKTWCGAPPQGDIRRQNYVSAPTSYHVRVIIPSPLYYVCIRGN